MRKINWDALSKFEQTQLLQREMNIDDELLQNQVSEIIQSVRVNGDEALKTFTTKFDNVALESITVTQREFNQALNDVSSDTKKAIEFAILRIQNYTKAQLPENTVVDTQDGIVCERLWRPISRVGLYVPAGTASLLSTLLMLAIPAIVANCEQIVLCTPPRKDGTVAPDMLVAAKMCGISQVMKVGGAQAIAAMSYGTQTIPKVDKIFGPGNRYVTSAKLMCAQCSQGASIDLPAGPSEILVIADNEASPNYVAADLLSQAEHDISSQVFLISPSETFVDAVIVALVEQLKALPRRSIALAALQKSAAIIVKDVNKAIEISNQYAPEHLSLQLKNPRQYISQIQNAGTVFVGRWTPETLGDYVTGANHVLPTKGNARTYSGLSVLDYMKTIGVQEASKTGLVKLAPFAKTFARREGLFAHENAVSIRMNEATNE